MSGNISFTGYIYLFYSTKMMSILQYRYTKYSTKKNRKG